ncbi:MAG: glycosyltransferase [Actinomycetaceae bacterium]|nr:glycosyltransferase [Actinomycetaceae bacterium]
MASNEQKVAVIIPAKDEAERIAETVRAARAIPKVDLVVVVDDGSSDETLDVARSAGATAVRHTTNRGKAAAMETGASVVAMRDVAGVPAHLLMFIDADLGESALETASLIYPVISKQTDVAIAALPPQEGAGGHGFVVGLGKSAIEKATGWKPLQPLSGQRCLTRTAFDAACPLAAGWGVEVGMTIDLLAQGFTVQEVPCDLQHRATANDLSGTIHRGRQYLGVLKAVLSRRARRIAVPAAQRNPQPCEDYQPYKALV